MNAFPGFMKHPANRIATGSQHTRGIEGYLFDGADGSQMAIWTCDADAESEPHVHDFDEYIAVVQGRYTVLLQEEKIVLGPGEEHLVPAGVPHGGTVEKGTRVICAFGGRRAERAPQGAVTGD